MLKKTETSAERYTTCAAASLTAENELRAHAHVEAARGVGGVTLVNSGSIGSPKDVDARAAYVMLDATATGVQVKIVPLACDVETAARGMMQVGLPTEFAEFLRKGGG